MKTEVTFDGSGTVTSPPGFLAGATYAGIKKAGAGVLDLGLLYSETPCAAAGCFTTNRIKAAPVLISQKRLPSDGIRALVVNSGCANASVGEPGLRDAATMIELAARQAGVAPESCLVASTGVIGRRLPMPLIEKALGKITLTHDGGTKLARAIMTTDTVPKTGAVTVNSGKAKFTIGGIAKGAGMIHPNLATLLSFITTDAVVSTGFLQAALKEAADISFNMVSIDGDMSPNDTLIILANGRAGNEPIAKGSSLAVIFQEALNQLCVHLAKGIARDGEGATRLIEVNVNGAASRDEARLAARTIVSSSLVKSAVHGKDPNWGRVMAALGRSGAWISEDKINLDIGGIGLVRGGLPVPFNEPAAVKALGEPEVRIDLELNLGEARATAWGCDLSEEYVTINSDYTT